MTGDIQESYNRIGVKKEFPQQYAKYYGGKVAFWSNSYYVASAGGAPIETLKQYIQGQTKPKD